MKNDHRCGTCRFWEKSDLPPSGLCRRRDPQMDGWPQTKSSDWCGKYDQNKAQRDREALAFRISREAEAIVKNARQCVDYELQFGPDQGGRDNLTRALKRLNDAGPDLVDTVLASAMEIAPLGECRDLIAWLGLQHAAAGMPA